jgi:SWI/SNF-related matrix-associated actin-dependent regulator of chromatin subfamily B protein 1
MIIKLRGKDKLRKLLRDLKSGKPPASQHTPTITRASSTLGTPAPGSMGPPSTPGIQNQTLQPTTPAAAAAVPLPQGQIGRVDAPPPPTPGQPALVPPPPPTWLSQGLTSLLATYPNDRFEGVMRYSAISTITDLPTSVPPPGPIPDTIKFMYLPRIRCHDCPGKLYTPGPETTVGNFEVHLKNRQHRERVDHRLTAASSSQAGAGA